MRNVLVIGGSGALGRAVVAAFRGGWRTTSVDLV
jgi:nucleoside-diphosphate-sugar epimerase